MQTVQIRGQLCITGNSLTNALKAPIKLLISLDCFIVSLRVFLLIRPCVSSIKSSRSFFIFSISKAFSYLFLKMFSTTSLILLNWTRKRSTIWLWSLWCRNPFEAMFTLSNSCRTKHSTFELLSGSDETSNEDFKSNVAR